MPIRALSELTGVAATTLRAWERRYGLLQPERTSSGHRLYTQTDVALVRAVVALLQQGLSIGAAAAQVRQGGIPDGGDDALHADQWSHLRQRMLHAVEQFSEGRLEQVYNEALSVYPFDLVAQTLIRPCMEELGTRWSARHTGVGEEHFFSAFLRNKLGARLHHEATRTHGSRLLVACLPDEFHELGALLFSLAALARGYRVLYLGAALPFAQLAAVVQRSQVAAIVLSGTTRPLDAALQQQWQEAEPAAVPVLFGGPFAVSHGAWIGQIGAVSLGEELRHALDLLLTIVPPYPAR